MLGLPQESLWSLHLLHVTHLTSYNAFQDPKPETGMPQTSREYGNVRLTKIRIYL